MPQNLTLVMKRVSNCREAKTINKTSIQYILSPNPQEDTMTKANDTQNDETQPSQSSSDPAKKDGIKSGGLMHTNVTSNRDQFPELKGKRTISCLHRVKSIHCILIRVFEKEIEARKMAATLV